MINFDPSGIVAVMSLDLIDHVNTKYPDVAPGTASMAGLMFTVEKAILAKTDPVDFMMAVTIAWAFVAGIQALVNAAEEVIAVIEEPAPAPATPQSDPPKVVNKTAKGVH